MRWAILSLAAMAIGLGIAAWASRPRGREIGYYEVHTYEGDVIQAWQYRNGLFRSPRMVEPVGVYRTDNYDGVVRLAGYRAANRSELCRADDALFAKLCYGYFGSVENFIPTERSWAWLDCTASHRWPDKPAWVKPSGPR